MKNFALLCFSFLTSIQATHYPPLHKKIVCSDVQQIYPLNDTSVIINTLRECFIFNIATYKKTPIITFDHYHELIKHPLQSLCALSDHESIRIIDPLNLKVQSFKTRDDSYSISRTVNRCTFNPHDTTIFYHKYEHVFSLNYKTGESKEYSSITRHPTTFYAIVRGGSYIPSGHHIAFNLNKKELCLSNSTTITVFNLDNSFSRSFPISDNYQTLPFFVNMLNNGLIIYAQHPNGNPCYTVKKIDPFDLNPMPTLCIIKPQNGKHIISAALHPSGSIVALLLSSAEFRPGTKNISIQYWNIENQKLIEGQQIKGTENSQLLLPYDYCLGFSPTGNTLVFSQRTSNLCFFINAPFLVSKNNICFLKKLVPKLVLILHCLRFVPQDLKYYLINTFLQHTGVA